MRLTQIRVNATINSLPVSRTYWISGSLLSPFIDNKLKIALENEFPEYSVSVLSWDLV